MNDKTYIAIDLKSFFASVECMERGLDPLKTNLVVADESRTEKTICLVNALRSVKAPRKQFSGGSCDADELKNDPALKVEYIIAKPRMSYYMQYSTRVYNTYLKYVAPDDIHVYSIDEVFIDATPYLSKYGLTAREFAMRLILDVLKNTGVTATAGIGINLYLAKIPMDIGATYFSLRRSRCVAQSIPSRIRTACA